jgi:hypothetical protein
MMYRQGDVLIIRVEGLPQGLDDIPRDNGDVVLAYGEATGHRHAIKSKAVRFGRDKESAARFLDIQEDEAKVVHEEHAPIVLPRGQYQVVTQREYEPRLGARPVFD